jgi:hypothetical protein
MYLKISLAAADAISTNSYWLYLSPDILNAFPAAGGARSSDLWLAEPATITTVPQLLGGQSKWSQCTALSRPLLRLMVGEYWFCLSCLSMMVIGSFASYTKTKSVESAVWCLLTLDDDLQQVAGSKYLNTVQGQNCSFLFSNNDNYEYWWEWNKQNNQTMNKIMND